MNTGVFYYYLVPVFGKQLNRLIKSAISMFINSHISGDWRSITYSKDFLSLEIEFYSEFYEL